MGVPFAAWNSLGETERSRNLAICENDTEKGNKEERQEVPLSAFSVNRNFGHNFKLAIKLRDKDSNLGPAG